MSINYPELANAFSVAAWQREPAQSIKDNPVAVLAEIPAGVLIVDAEGIVRFSNASASTMFALMPAADIGIRSLLHLSGVSNAVELNRAIDARAPSDAIRVGLPDGRILDARIRPLHADAVVITLVDVTTYVREAALAANDPLTGLPNRAGLIAHLTNALGSAKTTGAEVAVLYLDLDRFKLVNDTLGHHIGDLLLIKVADRLRNATRRTDMVARLGGDEFAIVQENESQPRSAEQMARRLVELIGRTYVISGHQLNIGASIGIALAPAHGHDRDTVLRHADLALYRAKADGRSRFRFFQSSMDAEMQVRRRLEEELRRALPLREFHLVYQPQYRLDPHRLIGFEVLLRWSHPRRGAVATSEFIPVAEEIGLIIPIGEWVLHTACREATNWDPSIGVAVNVSAAQFRNGKLVDTVRAVLRQSGLEPSRLELEITETALLDNTEIVLAQLRGLKQLGVRVAMDDFGTGYSSLSYLRKFPFDKIKIDQSFVQGVEESPDCGAIVRAVVALGQSLGIDTIAEGIETDEQLSRIKAEGCRTVQGFLTGRPMSPEAAIELQRAVAPEQT